MTFSLQRYHEFYSSLGYDRSSMFIQWTIKEHEAAILSEYCTGAKTAVSVGTFGGLSVAIILDAMADDGTHYGIDPFFPKYVACDNYRAAYDATIEHFRRPGQQAVTFPGFASISGNETPQYTGEIPPTESHQLRRVPPGVDVCFIDGDHHHPVPLNDFQAVWPLIRPGGRVLHHDISNETWGPHAIPLLEHIRQMPDADLWTDTKGEDGIAIVTKKSS
jgi:hypothetical protein